MASCGIKPIFFSLSTSFWFIFFGRNDFSEKDTKVSFRLGRGFMLNEVATRALLNGYTHVSTDHKIEVTFRGHQHSASDGGLLWDLIGCNGLVGFWRRSDSGKINDIIIQEDGALVYSLLSCPAANLLFSVDSVVHLDIESHNKWRLKHIYSKVQCKK